MEPNAHEIPSSLKPFSACLKSAALPATPFDAAGAWTHTYALWITGPQADKPPERRGHLTIRRKPIDTTTARLQVERKAMLYGTEAAHYADYYSCDLLCRTDALATPVSWTVHSDTHATSRPLNPWVVYDRQGTYDLATIAWQGRKRRTRAASRPCTTNWSLFDAVQRLPLTPDPPLAFDLLDEAELFKANHTLYFRGTRSFPAGNAAASFHGFEQVGAGIYPQHYWLDDQHRLVLFTDGFRAFTLESAAAKDGAV